MMVKLTFTDYFVISHYKINMTFNQQGINNISRGPVANLTLNYATKCMTQCCALPEYKHV